MERPSLKSESYLCSVQIPEGSLFPDFPSPVLSALRELSAFPYENLSKIVAFHQNGAGENPLGLAADWLASNRDTGAGGTCFSLTWWLRERIRAARLDCAFLMGDKGGAKNIHCGLRFDWGGRSFLLDPGYMIFDPLPLPQAGLSAAVWISPNEVRLEDSPAGSVWRLWSGPRGEVKWRFDFRKRAVSEEEFLAHWKDSYRLPMMRYPVLNRVRDGVQYYLQKRSLLVRAPEGGSMRKLSQAELMEALQVTFGIPEELGREAIAIVTSADADFFRK